MGGGFSRVADFLGQMVGGHVIFFFFGWKLAILVNLTLTISAHYHFRKSALLQFI